MKIYRIAQTPTELPNPLELPLNYIKITMRQAGGWRGASGLAKTTTALLTNTNKIK